MDRQQPAAAESQLFVGPADGLADQAVAASDGRSDQWSGMAGKMAAAARAVRAIGRIPADYSLLYGAPSALCPPAKYDRFGQSLRTLSTLTDREFANSAAASVDCGAVFLRSDLNGTNGFDLLESLIWYASATYHCHPTTDLVPTAVRLLQDTFLGGSGHAQTRRSTRRTLLGRRRATKSVGHAPRRFSAAGP